MKQTLVDMQCLQACVRKIRQATREAEEGKSHCNIVHSLYKLASFLHDALPRAWPEAVVQVEGRDLLDSAREDVEP